MASRARAAGGMAWASPVGGCTYWSTGSATAKNRISVPMPAAKSMAVQAKVEKSGVELSGPRRMRPNREKARLRMKTSAAVMSRM